MSFKERPAYLMAVARERNDYDGGKMTPKKAQKIEGPYFVVGTNIYRHWPDSTPGEICEVEKKYGPDFVDSYTTRKAAQKDADAMNKAHACKGIRCENG